MLYTLSGFTHDMGFRVFAFEGVGEDRVRTEYKVKADLALIRRYGIRVQELPLLCRRILEQRNEGEQQRTFTYTEGEMSCHADVCAAQAEASKKRTPRRPPGHNVEAVRQGAVVPGEGAGAAMERLAQPPARQHVWMLPQKIKQ